MKSLQINCELLTNLSLASCRFSNQTSQDTFTLSKLYLDPVTQVNPSFLYLKRLDLTSSFKGDEHVIQLANSSAFKYLEFLKLKSCGVSNNGFKAILASRFLRRLKVLILSKNDITKLIFPCDDLKTATKTQQKREFMELVLLDLRNNHISNTNQAGTSKFLRNTMVLGWDNGQSHQKFTEQHLQKTKHFTSLMTRGDGTQANRPIGESTFFNPFYIVAPSESQRRLVDMI